MTSGNDGHDRAGQQRLLGLAAIAVIIGLAAVYVTGSGGSNAPAPPEAAAPRGSGGMAAFVRKSQPVEVPAFKFLDAGGRERTLADWQGRVVLLNLWATWCAPCLKEMPDLDKLQAALGSKDFEVVAVSVDRTGVAGARKFRDQTGIRSLALYADPSARLASTLGAVGLPATLLIGRDGREIGRLLGPADWSGEDAVRLVRAALQ